MDEDSVLQLVLVNHAFVEFLFFSFAYDIECPVPVLLCKTMKGLYQQVEAFMPVGESSDGQKSLGLPFRRSSWFQCKWVVDDCRLEEWVVMLVHLSIVMTQHDRMV